MPETAHIGVQTNCCLGFRTVDWRWRETNDEGSGLLPVDDPDYCAAHAIYSGDLLVQAELGARLLADQPPEDIAGSMEISVATVTQFGFWFFDVVKNLEVTSWITHSAIRRNPTGALGIHQVGSFLRWVGYTFGIELLESLLRAVDRDTLRQQGLLAYTRLDVPLDLGIKLMVCAELVPVPTTARKLARLQQLMADPVWTMQAVTPQLAVPLSLSLEAVLTPRAIQARTADTDSEVKRESVPAPIDAPLVTTKVAA